MAYSWPFPKAILPGPRHVTSDVVEALADGTPDALPRLFLLDCSEPEELIRSKWPRFDAYVKIGHEENISDTYLASRRAPWYSQEKRPPDPFLCTIYGALARWQNPFRFIWNRLSATAHNVVPERCTLEARCSRHYRITPSCYSRVFEALKSITPAQLLSEGRVYGGGLIRSNRMNLPEFPPASC